MYEDMKAFPFCVGGFPLHIPLSGVSFCDSSYHIRRTNSGVSVIEYIIDGAGYVDFNGEVHHVCKDTIYFLPQGTDQYYYADKDDPFTKIFLNIKGTLCEQLTSAYGLTDKHFFAGGGLKKVFEKIPSIIHSSMKDDEIQSALQGVFVEILSSLCRAQADAKHSEEALILKGYLDKNTDRIVSGEELSKVIFRSPDYCLKLFGREFGTTPYAYQIKSKMLIAKSLLTDTEMSVGEIAESLGYSDFHYFSNLFKTKCGCRPTTYRKGKR